MMNSKELFLIDIIMLKLNRELIEKTFRDVVERIRSDIHIKRYDSLFGNKFDCSYSDIICAAAALDPDIDDERSTHAACLCHALTFHYLATLAALKSTLVIGVMNDGARLLSHAWVELGNGEFLDSGSQRQFYRTIYTLEL